MDSVLKKIFYFYADKTGLYDNDSNLASSHYTNFCVVFLLYCSQLLYSASRVCWVPGDIKGDLYNKKVCLDTSGYDLCFLFSNCIIQVYAA